MSTSPQGSKIIWLVAVFVIATALIVGGSVYLWPGLIPKSIKQSLQPPTSSLQNQTRDLKPEPTVQAPDNNYQVVLKENPQDSSKTDVYLKSPDNNKEELFITLTDIYTQHYHNSEYHHGNLYIIRRMGDISSANGNWSDELWKYDSQKQGTKIYSNKGIDFRVAPNEKYIAVSDKKLSITDQNGQVIHAYVLNDLSLEDNQDLQIGLLKWSDDSRQFWGDLFLTAYPQTFDKIDIDSWQVDKYDVSKLGFSDDYDLNSNNGKLVYSDYAAMFDAQTVQEHQQSGTKVNLIVYDLEAKTQTQVATSTAKAFKPRWVTDNTIEYNDPDSDNRARKTIE